MRSRKLMLLAGLSALIASSAAPTFADTLAGLPSGLITSPTFQKVPATDALRSLLQPHGITVVRDFETLRADEYLTLITAAPNRAELKDQVKKLLDQAGLSGTYRVDTARLYVKPERGQVDVTSSQPLREVSVSSAVAPLPVAWNLLGSGETLRSALNRWSITANWKLSWEVVDHDFVIEQPAVLEGTFIEAVEKVIDSLKDTNLPIKAIAYEGNHVLRILPANGDR